MMGGTSQSGTITSNVIWRFAERILAQLITFIVSVVLARILLPDDYGTVAYVTVFISFLDILVTNGLPTALVQKKGADDLDYSSVFYINVVVSIALYIILFFCARPIANFYKIEELVPVVRVMGIRVIIASVNSVQHSYVSKNMMFRKYFWATLFGTITSGVVGVLMAYRGFGVWAIVSQYLTNSFIDTVFLWFTVGWRPIKAFSLERVRKLFSFGWKILAEAIAETFSKQFRNLVIGKAYTSADLAYYNKAQQIPTLITNNIGVSIVSVLFPAMAEKQENRADVLGLLRKSTRTLAYIVMPMLVGLSLVAKNIIILLLTEKWIESVPYLQICCFSLGINLLVYIKHQALLAIGRSTTYVFENMFVRVVTITLVLLTYRISVFAIVITEAVCAIVLMLTTMYTSKKYNQYEYYDQLKDLLPSCFICFGMAIPVVIIGTIQLPLFIMLLMQIVVGSGVYILISHLLKLDEYNYCIRTINKVFRKKRI